MQRCVLIDNNHLAMLASPENSIAINDFMGDPSDSELFGAYDMLMTMKDLTDVRPFIKETFKTHLEIAEIFEQMEIGASEDSIPPRAGTDVVTNSPQPSCQSQDGEPPVQVHTEERKVDSLPSVVLPPPIQIPRPNRGTPPNLELEDDSYSGTTPRVLAATYSHQFATPMRTVPRRLGEEPLDELMSLPAGSEGFVAEVDDPVVASFQLCLVDADHPGILGRSQYTLQKASPAKPVGVLQEVGL